MSQSHAGFDRPKISHWLFLTVTGRDRLFKLLIKFLYGQVSSHRLFQKIKSMSYFFRSEQVKIAFLGKIRARKLNILTLKDVDLVDYPLQLMPLGATPYFQKVICYIKIRFFFNYCRS